MYQYGHYGAALLGYAPLGFLLAVTGFEDLAILGAVGAAALAMVPDVNLRVPLVTHRGVTKTSEAQARSFRAGEADTHERKSPHDG